MTSRDLLDSAVHAPGGGLTADETRRLDDEGFLVVEEALTRAECLSLRAKVHDLAAEERRDERDWSSNGNQKVFNLVDKGQEFLDLALHPEGFRFARHFLGDHALLSSFTANITMPRNKRQAFHADQQYVTPPWPHVFAMNLVWTLDPFTVENGATVAVPGSHHRAVPPSAEDDGKGGVSVVCPAGSLIVMDGRLWHGSGANTSPDETRVGLLVHYCAPFLRQQENVFRSLDPGRRRQLSSEERRLLGFDVWSGLGVVGGLPRDWRDRADRSGPTNPDGIFPS